MPNCVIDNSSTVMARLIAFETAIANSKFSIKGVNDEKDLVVVEDTSKDEGIYGKFIEIPIKELMKPIEQLMDVLNLKRKDLVLDGISRIVGYYSRISNWNSSKKSEIHDRILGRYEGGYGFNGSEVNYKQLDEALQYVDNSPR
ncbi:MAG: hypothetical protein V3U54_09910 [Thermodesulfobacteriota bacterium]